MNRKDIYSHIKQFCFQYRYILIIITLCIVAMVSFGIHLRSLYKEQFGGTVYDRYGRIIYIYPNSDGALASSTADIPTTLKEKILDQEDQMFYYHLGFNPVRWVSGSIQHFKNRKKFAVSTIPEQLTKNLLDNNKKRTFLNKVVELIGSLSLELCFSKDTILNMYSNSVSMGKNIKGMHTASWFYYDKPLSDLTNDEQLSLVRTIPRPSTLNPASNQKSKFIEFNPNKIYPNSYPELLNICAPPSDCTLSIDRALTDTLRLSSRHTTEKLWDKRGRNAAIVVLDVKSKKVLSLIGSPDPLVRKFGYQIDMTKEYRPIGSTVKPFIYSLAFENGATPNTIVSDSEHQLYLGTGFPFYPQDFDGKYRGDISIEEALAQSLNIPTVKTLEFVGADTFYNWLKNKAHFQLLQSEKSYGSSSALGSLEMTPESLAYLYTAFAQNGNLEPYSLFNSKNTIWKPAGISEVSNQNIFSESSVHNINKILTNRFIGVSQFGVGSNLNLPIEHYGVKTGTSRDYHDSWVVGYTPDIVVVVWIGNVENEPLNEVTGQSGAGDLWEVTMNELTHLGYITDTPFQYKETSIPHNLTKEKQEIKKIKDSSVYTFPQNNDVLRLKKNSALTLSSVTDGVWIIDGVILGTGNSIRWVPQKAKEYIVKHPRAQGNQFEQMKIEIQFD